MAQTTQEIAKELTLALVPKMSIPGKQGENYETTMAKYVGEVYKGLVKAINESH